MTTELIHTGRDNTNEFVLLADGVPLADASAITRMVLTLSPDTGGDDVVVDSENASAGAFDWSATTQYEGSIVVLLKLLLGGVSIPAGDYEGKLEIYAPDYANGLVWDDGIPFKVV